MQATHLHDLIERGFLRVLSISPDLEVLVEETAEGMRARLAVQNKTPIYCAKCDAPYKGANRLPKYDACPDCRKNEPKVTFIERPS